MPTSYTSLLGLALPVTGELAGTWGTTVNDYITQYIDAAVAGAQTISGTQTAVTLSTTNGTALVQAGAAGTTGSAQYQIINCTGNPAGLLTITVPAQSKAYLVINATSTSQSVKVVGSGPTTGVTMVSGEKALIAWNGSDFVKVASSEVDGVSTISFGTTGLTPSTATSGAVSVAGTLVAANGGTGQSSYTTGDLLYATGTTALSKLGIGASGRYLSSSGTAPQWSAPAALTKTDDTNVTLTLGGSASTALLNAASLTLGWTGQLATSRGGTGLSSFTANGVVYASSTSALATGSVLTFDGAQLGVNGVTVGRGAGAVSTNTAVGASALASNTTGSRNTAVGLYASLYYTTGSSNTAVGISALYGASGTSTGSANTAVGDSALTSNTSGNYNTALGVNALVSNTTANSNTAVGYQSAYSTTTGIRNVSMGHQSLYANTTGNYSVAIGYIAAYNTNADDNVAVGTNALYTNTTYTGNVAVGRNALYAANGGNEQTAVGTYAMEATTTGSVNVAVGGRSLRFNTTGSYNAAVGYQALQSNTTGGQNSAVGYQTAYSTTTGSPVDAFGSQALFSNTTGSSVAAFGYRALYANTTGNYNAALGTQALYSNTTASNNTAVGYQAGYTNTTGTRLAALGYRALATSTGDGNTALGYKAQEVTSSGTENTAVGDVTLASNTTGSYNTALGANALVSNTTASNNTAVGYQAGYSNTTGSSNVFIGYQCAQNATGTGNVYVGNVTPSGNTDNYGIVIGATSGSTIVGKGSSTGFISPNGGGVYQGNNSSSWSTTSDRRLKKNIVDNNEGLDKITQIRVRNFEYRLPEEVDAELAPSCAIEKTGVQLGVIAQELQEVCPDCVKQESTGVLSVDSDNVFWHMVNAIKQLKSELDTVKAELATLKGA